MWAPTASTCTTTLPSGYQSVYGKSVPSISSRSHWSNACRAAGLPISPVWPTWNGLSRSRPSLALSVSTIGADSFSASASTSARASRAPMPASRVTLSAASMSRAASCSACGSGTTFAGGAMKRALGRVLGQVELADVAREREHRDPALGQRALDGALEQVRELLAGS